MGNDQTRPWGIIDPNSQHQLWSRWVFSILGKEIPLREVEANAANWLRLGFGTVGRARVTQRVLKGQVLYIIEAEVEGKPAHDPSFVASVRRAFDSFVYKGWGPLGTGTMSVRILAGDEQSGAPRKQLVVVPTLDPRSLLKPGG